MWVEVLENEGYEAVPLTRDSVIDNIRSLESSDVVVVWDDSPSWVMRESLEHHKFTVSWGSSCWADVTVQVNDLDQFRDLIRRFLPYANPLTPVDKNYVEFLAKILALYPVRPKLD